MKTRVVELNGKKKTYVLLNGLEVTELELIEQNHTKESAIELVKKSGMPKEASRAMYCFAEMLGWDNTNAMANFADLAEYRAKYWGFKGNSLAKYLIYKCGEDIENMREYIKMNGNDVKSALLQKIN